MSNEYHLWREGDMRRIQRFVRGSEANQPSLAAAGMRKIPPVELIAFRVVSDLSQEAIDAGTAEHGRTVTCDFASDSQPGLTDIRDGCMGPSGATCNGIVLCFPCDVTVTLVDEQEVAGPLGTVWTFEWAGGFAINNIDTVNCGWGYETRYVPTSANAAGVRLSLSNLGIGAIGTCQLMRIRDVNRFGDTDPGAFGGGSTFTLVQTPNCTKVVFSAGGSGNVWGVPARPIYELTWTCTDEQIAAGQAMLESMLPECVLGRLDGGETPAGRWTVDLSLFGGSPEPGSVILARNIGGRWYAIGGRNTRIVGAKASGSAPFRLDVDGCDLRRVPFEYMNQTYGAGIEAGAAHVVTWQPQKRKYIATRFEDTGEPNQAMNPYRCACCFEAGPCMFFSIDTGGTVPALDGDYETCRTNALADWAEPTYTAKKKAGWDSGYFATEVFEHSTGCFWQAAQYCIDDPDGNRGRSWVVDLYFKEPDNTVSTLTTTVQTWQCKCKGSLYEWSMTGDVPDCIANPTTDYCDGCTYDCLTATIPGFTISASVCTVAERTLTFNLDTSGSPCIYDATPDAIYQIAHIYWTGSKWRLVLQVKGTGGANCPVGTGSFWYECDTCTGSFEYVGKQYSGESGFPAGPITVSGC